MTTNFTLRDFFVYLLTGILSVIILGIIFNNEIYQWVNDVKSDKNLLFIMDKFNFLITIFLIPALYFLGQIVGTISIFLLKVYDKTKCFRKCLIKKKKGLKGVKYVFLIILLRSILCLRCFLYYFSYKVKINQIVDYYIKKRLYKPIFTTKKDFSVITTELQVREIYTSSDYKYIVKDFFENIYLIFLGGTILAFFRTNWILGVIFLVFSLLCYYRAYCYAKQYVETVCHTIEVIRNKM